MLHTKFRVIWPYSSSEEGKNRFSRCSPSWIFDRNNFSYFYIYKSSRHFPPIFKSTGPLVQEIKRKKRVSRWPISDPNNLSYSRSTILDLQVTRMLPTKFRVKWPFSSGGEAKNKFSRCLSWRPSWISDRDDFSYF